MSHRIVSLIAVVLLAGAVMPWMTQPRPVAAAQFACSDVHAVWARGANLGPGQYDWDSYINNELRNRVLSPVTFTEQQLGTGGYSGHLYQPTDDVGLVVEGLTSPLPFGPFDASVQSGIDELTAYLGDRAVQCPSEVYVLGGYSEGADVIGRGPLTSVALDASAAVVVVRDYTTQYDIRAYPTQVP